ncbi:MAG: hypothetical protein CFE24_07985 [Flavobacterium sp. BFFFF2]|nr:MAG: hypothetical protein CFE24_07985 [Flavobacterium sp. BFFFF2]
MGLIWITNAIYLEDYKIELAFNNNTKGVFDFENHLNQNIFLPLKDLEMFKKFKLNSWTVEWENGADFSPEFLLENLS